MIVKKLEVILFVFISTIAYSQNQTDNYSELYLDSIFRENPGTFVLYDLQNENYKVYNPERSRQKFAVHSTSKILWSVIGLEKKLISNETDIVKWDSIKWVYDKIP